MKKYIDKNQTSLNFELVDCELQKKKQYIRRQHKEMNTTFHYEQTTLNALVKLTYDITDKDFEYLYAYILKKQGFKEVKVIGGLNDHGVDVRGLKNGVWHFIQCKQWSQSYIHSKQIGEFIGAIHHYQKEHENGKFIYVTTSYPNGDARELLHDNNIMLIDNKGLIGICKSLGILTDEGWENMIKEIQLMRLNDMRIKDPQSGFEELKRIRISEALNHIPDYKNYLIDTNISSGKYPFFQYWDLV